MFAKPIAPRRGCDNARSGCKGFDSLLVPGACQHREVDVGTLVQTTEQGAHIGADTEIGKLPPIEHQPHSHGAIVAVSAPLAILMSMKEPQPLSASYGR